MLRLGLVASMLVLGFTAPAHAQSGQPKAPLPPQPQVPTLSERRPAVACVDCDAPFDFETHKEAFDQLLNNSYMTELRKALYFQDTYHQFESKAHFDNCDFQSSMDYLSALLTEIDAYAVEAEKVKTTDRKAAEGLVRKAFFTLGQAMHGTQDFYAHTNYVELSVKKVKKVIDIEILAPWRAEARPRILQLQTEGLVSGVVSWGFPKKCAANTVTHGKLAKDSPTTASGQKRVAHLENLSQHRIAAFLAREASISLLRDAFKRWPVLKEFNGPNVLIDVLVDRRGL